jgi:surface polysaccharide O-acyltransferase-like enzyme
MNILDQVSSVRLNLIRFPLIVGIVYIHAYDSVVSFGGTESVLTPTSFAGNFIRDFISGGLAGVAVPLFFFMSGFLFFNNFDWSGGNYLIKVKSRIKTLLVPFLFWNLLWLGIIAIAQNIPATAQYFAGGIPHITQSGPYDIFNLLIGIDRHPIVFQFWYIRDLIILVMLVPLIHLTLVNKVVASVILVGIFGVWLVGVQYDTALSIIPGPLPVFFFYAGSVLAIYKKTPFFLDKYGFLMIAVFGICTSLSIVYKDNSLDTYLYRIGRLTGMFAALYTTRYFITRGTVRNQLSWLAGTSFFVFAFHEPIMEIAQRLILGIWSPGNDVERLLLYFILPLIIIGISIAVYILLKRISPSFVGIITGGRHVSRTPRVQNAD